MKRRFRGALTIAIATIVAWTAATIGEVSAGSPKASPASADRVLPQNNVHIGEPWSPRPQGWSGDASNRGYIIARPLPPAPPAAITTIHSDTFTPLLRTQDGLGIQHYRFLYLADRGAAPNYFAPAENYGHFAFFNSPELTLGPSPMSAVSAEVCLELEFNSTVMNEWARLYFGVQDKDRNVIQWKDPDTEEPFLWVIPEGSQQCHTLTFPQPVRLVNNPHLLVGVELMLDSGSGAIVEGVTYALRPSRGGDLTPTDESQWPDVVGATVYPGTIQRAYSSYPCYTLTYSDAYQTYPVFLPANEITFSEGGSALPNPIPNPVAVDYVGPIDTYHYTLDFRYQGTYYSSKWDTSCPQKNPYVWGDANHCNIPFADKYFGTVYIYSWDLAKNDWVKAPAPGVLVTIYAKDCDPPCGSGEVREVGTATSDADGYWHKTTGQTYDGEGYVTYSLAGYPPGEDDLDNAPFCIED